ncbi:hypothetical protein PAECIP111893_02434 [Paenibacillus plantiphilus]|uniref:HTH cro/C1-type domain-containing protein n=1 Tax=Paenibacillus plantiphilus TaxID=2905650 RepID=A0ABN8GGN7_9BACL|nr:helix-turn-helix transcriptional regulator [Paenibacillus plantiphilus]CAH1205836.1 hypothetical protein PAECIP111893_02434 [Paenibacillus plantiphilus]
MNITEMLKMAREKRGISLREAAKRSGLSHSYIDSLEKGIHPATKTPIRPSPLSLKSLSEAYNCDYMELMQAAGYIEENEKENAYTLPESIYEQVIKEAEENYGVSLRDDPVVNSAVRELILSLAKMKKGNE